MAHRRVAPEAVAALQEAMEGYQAAVLEAAGHPVVDLERLVWSGPCGHVWVAPQAARGEPVPLDCPLCEAHAERDRARDLAVALEAELAAVHEAAQRVVAGAGAKPGPAVRQLGEVLDRLTTLT